MTEFALWAAAAAKAVLAAPALALVRPATARFARPARFAGGIAGGALTLYGAAGLIEFGLMAVGARDVPTDVGDAAVLWYVLLWEPLWLLGGLLFLAATRQAARTTSHPRARKALVRRAASALSENSPNAPLPSRR